MCETRKLLSEKYKISVHELQTFERVGAMGYCSKSDYVSKECELRLAVIAKAKSMRFSFEEIVFILKQGC